MIALKEGEVRRWSVFVGWFQIAIVTAICVALLLAAVIPWQVTAVVVFLTVCSWGLMASRHSKPGKWSGKNAGPWSQSS